MSEYSLFAAPFLTAIVAAAGSSTRMAGVDKQLLPLLGVPVLARSLLALQNCEMVNAIVVVTDRKKFADIPSLAREYSITKFHAAVLGGNTRSFSVMNALSALPPETEYIAIHDGARPLVTSEEIEQCALDAFSYGGAALGVPVTDTIKYVKKNGTVEYTPARERLIAVQTPQIFELKAYREAVEAAGADMESWTDDCRAFESSGKKVYITMGRRDNIKITSPDDIPLAETFLKQREVFF